MLVSNWKVVSSLVLAAVSFSAGAYSQAVAAPDVSTTGVVASSSSNTLVVKTTSGQFVLFVYDGRVVKPATIPNGSSVEVVSSAREDGVQVAHSVRITSAAPTASGAPAPSGASATPAGGASQDVIPPSVRNLENDIARQARRFQAGVQGGVGLDPEVILVGLNARMGPIFNRDIHFRPSVDFAFGEVTKMFQINADATYRLPLSARSARWSAYVGAGPNFSFVSQNFERAASGDNDVDFDDFTFKAGLNVLAGVEYRSGIFYELKAGVWTIPTLRIMVGYRF